MKVLFATKLLQDRNFQPLGLYALSAAIKACGHEAALVDATSRDPVIKAIKFHQPEVLAISTLTMRYRFFQQTAAAIKQLFPKLPIVIGGLHATLIPESIADEGFDILCRGEADRAFPELLTAIERGQPYHQLAGFWCKRDGEIIKNPVAPLVADLDSLPLPDRSLTDIYSYCHNVLMGIFSPSRGCLFDCTFCSNSTLKELYGQQTMYYRTATPERTIEEMKIAVKRYAYQRIIIMSEVFGENKRWLAAFAESYRREIGLPFWCMLNPEMVDEERAALLQSAGCDAVGLGIEVGDETMRRQVLGKNVSDEQLQTAIGTLHKFKLRVHSANIIGLPGSSLATDLATIDFNLKARVEFPDPSIFQPLPCTPLAARAIEMGLFDGDFEHLPTTLNPAAGALYAIRVPHRRVLRNLGYLFPLAAKSTMWRRSLPALIVLPLSPLYLIIYKFVVGWLKMKYLLGMPPTKVLSSRFVQIFINYLRH